MMGQLNFFMNSDSHKPAIPFDGTTRLFPLPGLVQFPGIFQGLHIFEQRYRQMTADALADDQRITLVLLQEGWDRNYDLAPPIHPVGCLGNIVRSELLEDGRYNLLFEGTHRVRILEELPTDRLYRTAKVEILPTIEDLSEPIARQLRDNFQQTILPYFPETQTQAKLKKLFQNENLTLVMELLASQLPLPFQSKQILLEMDGAEDRIRFFLEVFQQTMDNLRTPNRGNYDQPFSEN